jgi:hypothetical protein
MFELLPNTPPFDSADSLIRPSIFLDYGTDGASGEDAECEVCERGMRFKSQWQFDLGTVLSIAFAFEEGSPQRVEAEGIVIECTPGGERGHLTTLAFLDLPPTLRATLGKVSTRLDLGNETSTARRKTPS